MATTEVINQANTIYVREKGEWARFFWTEGKNADRNTFWACWTAYTSFGTYGHYWSDMGSEFVDFIQNVDSGYLLAKISRTEFSTEAFDKWLRREIFTSGVANEIKNKALQAWKEIRDEHEHFSAAAIPVLVQESPAINEIGIDWSECRSRDYPRDARRFAIEMWPAFAKAAKDAQSK